MGFKDDVRTKAIELEERVSALETAVREIQRVQRPGGYVGQTEVLPTRTTTTSTTGVDYGAVAFGLSEIARKVRGKVGATTEMTAYYRESVDYFADVFAKTDGGFDRDAFKRQAGV